MYVSEEPFAATIRRIAEDPQSRRELLWLRAKEKDDALDARWLLEDDPSIPTRLRYFHDADFTALDRLADRLRADAYGALYDAHLDWLIGRRSSEDARIERRRVARTLLGR